MGWPIDRIVWHGMAVKIISHVLGLAYLAWLISLVILARWGRVGPERRERRFRLTSRLNRTALIIGLAALAAGVLGATAGGRIKLLGNPLDGPEWNMGQLIWPGVVYVLTVLVVRRRRRPDEPTTGK